MMKSRREWIKMKNESGNHPGGGTGPPLAAPNGNGAPRTPIIVAIIGATAIIIAAVIAVYPYLIHHDELSTIQGTVTDINGMPVIGAVVEIDGLSVITDGSGTYVIWGVSAGTKTITVRVPGAEIINRALEIPEDSKIVVYDIFVPTTSDRPPPASCVKPQMMTYSPDGKMYACEIEPENFGHIGIFEVSTDKLIRKIKVTQHPDGEFVNDIKKLAWSPDSKYLAVMYHHDTGGHISIVNADAGIEIKRVPIDKWYHNIEFSSDGTKIIADGDILQVFSTPTLSTMVRITYPSDGSKVERKVTVRGTSQNIPEGQVIWVVIYVHEARRYFPQDLPADVQVNGDWVSPVIIGIDEDVGKEFDIIVVLVDQKAQDAFNDYLKDWGGKYPSPGLERLPEGALIYQRITVTRI